MTIFEITLFGIRIAPTYYGLAYAIGIYAAYEWVRRRAIFTEKQLEILLYTVVAGILLGGRLGYVLFYNPTFYWNNPLKILAFQEGGMSFHGGIIGVVIGLILFSKIQKIRLLIVSDAVALTVPIGILLGRIANYLNNELIGYAGYTGPFAMNKNGVLHFPSPLLEAVFEGGILLILLIWIQRFIERTNQKNQSNQINSGDQDNKNWSIGLISGVFLGFYGLSRVIIEHFFRLPDPQIGYILSVFTLGQLLSVPIIFYGCYLVYKSINAYLAQVNRI